MISNLDLAIIAAYLLLVVAIGIWVSVRTKTGEDLFLGGRSLTWGFIGLSLFASNISSTTLIGLAGAAYNTGIVHAVWEFSAGIPFLVLAVVFVPLYLRAKVTTVPEFLERRFDRRSRLFFSAVTIVISIVVDTAGGLYAGAIVLKAFFPDLVLWETCLALALFAGIYTAFGGLKAVVYTDALQAVILIMGCGLLTLIMFGQIDYSWSRMVEAAPEGHFSLVRPLTDTELPWPGLILGVPFLGFWYVATNQYITQRVLGAKSIQHARWGIMLACMLKMTPFFIMILPGAMAIVLFPGLTNGDLVFPTMVREVLPVGLVGLVMAGLISAIMSSVDSTLNSASTLIVVDFVKARHPELKPRTVAKYGRISTLILMIVAAAWAPMIANFGGLWAYLQQMFSIIVPPIVTIFLFGAFYKRGTGSAAFWTLVLGTIIGVVLFLLNLAGSWPLHYLMNVGLAIGLSSIIFVVISKTTEPPSQDVVERYTFNRSLIHVENENVPWYQNYLYQGGVVLFTIAATYVLLW